MFVSSYFAVPKPYSNKWRPVLNLGKFNENIRHYKFKMETFSKSKRVDPAKFLSHWD